MKGRITVNFGEEECTIVAVFGSTSVKKREREREREKENRKKRKGKNEKR